ncbi:Putative F-box protein At3g58860 [Linum grandiflorum]
MASDSVSIGKQRFPKRRRICNETVRTMAGFHSVSTAQDGEEVDCMAHKLFDKVRNLGQGLDCISQLPDELLTDIVSRLTLVEAIRTSVLSSRWINLWKSAVSVLDFAGLEELLAIQKLSRLDIAGKIRRYRDFVNGVVTQVQQSCSQLSKFWISFNVTNKCNSERHIDRWLKFAISKRVESLHLVFNLERILPWNYYVFSEECYNHIKTPAGLHDIGFLRSLRLRYVNVRGEILEHFIANCPVLEELSVNRSKHLEKLKVVGSSHSPLALKHLELRSCLNLAYVEIDHAPHLERLILVDSGVCEAEVQMGHCPSLVDIALDDQFISNETFRALSGCASQFISLFLKSHRSWQQISVAAEHSNLERLTVEGVGISRYSILGLVPLINLCPRLHTLQLLLYIHPYDIWGLPRVDVVKVSRDSIKVVEVVGFRGYVLEYKFMEYAMEYFVGLERIVIYKWSGSVVHGDKARRWSEEVGRKAEKRASELKSRAPPTIEFLII